MSRLLRLSCSSLTGLLVVAGCAALTPTEAADAGECPATESTGRGGGAGGGGGTSTFNACIRPADCANGDLCDRFTGACIRRATVTCGKTPDTEDGGAPVGNECVVGPFARTPYTCTGGSTCTKGGLFSPERWAGEGNSTGFCRRKCDPCTPSSCEGGEQCMLAGASGGVCFPVGVAQGLQECNTMACAPLLTCSVISGATGSSALSTGCEQQCSADRSCPAPLVCASLLHYDACRAGALVEIGEVCDDKTRFCSLGNTCGWALSDAGTFERRCRAR